MNRFCLFLLLLSLPAIVAAQAPRRTVRLPGDIEAQFVWVAPGSFRMGSPPEEAGRDADEGPQREVTLTRGYYLGAHEVTQRQWTAVMGNNPSLFRQPVAGEEALDRPVESISWEDAMRFIDPTGPASGDGRVIRGGSWFNEPEALRSANRHRHPIDSRQTNLGLRVVRELFTQDAKEQ